MLRTKSRSSSRTANTLNCWANTVVLFKVKKKKKNWNTVTKYVWNPYTLICVCVCVCVCVYVCIYIYIYIYIYAMLLHQLIRNNVYYEQVQSSTFCIFFKIPGWESFLLAGFYICGIQWVIQRIPVPLLYYIMFDKADKVY